MRVLLAVLLSGAVAHAAGARVPFRGGTFEASGATAVRGGEGVLMVDDARPGDVLWLPLSAEGAGDVAVVPTGVAVADPEGITTDGTWVYVVGSQSRGKGASLVRFRFNPATRAVTSAEGIAGLEDLLEAAVPALRPAAPGDGDGKGKGKDRKKQAAAALNIEGLAWDPDKARLLLGVRAPVVDGMALAIPVRVRHLLGPFTAANLIVDTPLLIDLGGSGIRGFEHNATDGTFLVIAGHPTAARDFRLVRWSGKDSSVQDVQAFGPGEKPEGVARVTVGGKPATIVVFDTSQYALLP